MIEIRLLGQLSAQLDGRALDALLQQRKRFAFFVYLVLGADQGFHEREALLAMFWPELDESHARQALRKALHHLRSQLGNEAIISRGRHRIAINADIVSCDARMLRMHARFGRHTDVLDKYGGDLLPGFHVIGAPEFDAWLEHERTQLRHLAYDAALKLARHELTAGSLQSALFFARQAERIWPTSEEAAELIIELLHRTGRSAAAIEEYRAFAARIARDLDLRPGESILKLVRNIHNTNVLVTAAPLT